MYHKMVVDRSSDTRRAQGEPKHVIDDDDSVECPEPRCSHVEDDDRSEPDIVVTQTSALRHDTKGCQAKHLPCSRRPVTNLYSIPGPTQCTTRIQITRFPTACPSSIRQHTRLLLKHGR